MIRRKRMYGVKPMRKKGTQMLYRDKAGNRLYRKYIKTRKIIQYFVKNRQGKLVNPSGLSTIIRKARRAGKFK